MPCSRLSRSTAICESVTGLKGLATVYTNYLLYLGNTSRYEGKLFLKSAYMARLSTRRNA